MSLAALAAAIPVRLAKYPATSDLPPHEESLPLVGIDPLIEIARCHGLVVIEDAAQAVGAEYKGRRAGSVGDVGCFSFYPAKNLGAYGEGGAVVTSNPDLADKVRMLRDWGQRAKYDHEEDRKELTDTAVIADLNWTPFDRV